MALAAMRRFCIERSLLEDETCASCDSLFYIGTIQRAIAVSRRSWPARPPACLPLLLTVLARSSQRQRTTTTV